MESGGGLRGVKGEMVRDTKVRTADKQHQLEIDYEEKLKDLLEEIETAKEEGDGQIDQTRQHHLARLQHLITQKNSIEKQILNHTADIFKAYEDMKLEMETVLRGKIEDYKEAEGMLEDDARDEDEQEAIRNTEMKDGQNTRDRGRCGHGEDGTGVSANEKQQSKKKIRIVPAKAQDQHAGGDSATADREGIIRDVPGKEQVRRAEAMAKQGRKV